MPDEQSEEAEVWMTEVQEKFNDATNRKIKYVEQITLKQRTVREDAERQEYIDKARTRRSTARSFRGFVQKYFARAAIEGNS